MEMTKKNQKRKVLAAIAAVVITLTATVSLSTTIANAETLTITQNLKQGFENDYKIKKDLYRTGDSIMTAHAQAGVHLKMGACDAGKSYVRLSGPSGSESKTFNYDRVGNATTQKTPWVDGKTKDKYSTSLNLSGTLYHCTGASEQQDYYYNHR